MLPDTKECPYCAETIKSKAIKCKHCHEFLPGYNRERFDREFAQGVAVGQESRAAGAVKVV